ncbi:hypothetical protein J9978_18705 [Chromobacterium violaceum]|uniref:hypothetical protein n=1 Tax=Chromobacterium violaceum TaxID=536 RepID=UPI001B322A93|nr:hypothetical protein [Chromobacterium violaceum]MBP4051508.1 hypothetical protein [Chromobacterium violaceum]
MKSFTHTTEKEKAFFGKLPTALSRDIQFVHSQPRNFRFIHSHLRMQPWICFFQAGLKGMPFNRTSSRLPSAFASRQDVHPGAGGVADRIAQRQAAAAVAFFAAFDEIVGDVQLLQALLQAVGHLLRRTGAVQAERGRGAQRRGAGQQGQGDGEGENGAE